MTRNEILLAIQQSPLGDEDLQVIIGQCTKTLVANSLIASGMDMLAQSVMSVDIEPEAAEAEGTEA